MFPVRLHQRSLALHLPWVSVFDILLVNLHDTFAASSKHISVIENNLDPQEPIDKHNLKAQDDVVCGFV